MEGGLPSDDEEVLLPYGKELEEARINCEYSESAVLPVHHQALLVQHQTSPQAKNSNPLFILVITTLFHEFELI